MGTICLALVLYALVSNCFLSQSGFELMGGLAVPTDGSPNPVSGQALHFPPPQYGQKQRGLPKT